MKKIILAVVALAVAFVAGAKVTAELGNPTDYTSPEWNRICLYNRTTPTGEYVGEILITPQTADGQHRGTPYTVKRSTPVPPVGYQNFINTWIGYARADRPEYN